MTAITPPWDYLIVTASNADQAKAYNDQLDLRRRLGLVAGVREVIVVADPGGKRVGSGGSTVFCLMEVLRRRLGERKDLGDPSAWLETLKGLRILIIHAGGDSRRLPAYGPCGKVFVPVPGESDSAISETIFDRQFPIYLALPPVPAGRGQIVVTAGDALLGFDPSVVRFTREGITGLGCLAPPDRASRHGVYCTDASGAVRLFLQKPMFQQQENAGAINRYGQSILDIGVMSLDAATAVVLLRLGGLAAEGGELKLTGAISSAIEEHGMDLYLEVCCAMGSGATLEQYLASVRGGLCAWGQELLKQTFETLWPVPFAVQILPRCRFLHFGTTRQIISSGEELLREDRGLAQLDIPLSINNHFHGDGNVIGSHSWVEGCRIASPLYLAGENVVVGVDVNEELSLPVGACLDIVQGRDRAGLSAWFVRCYGVGDDIKDSISEGTTFCRMPVGQWLETVGASPADVWDSPRDASRCSVWNARLFPAEGSADGFRRWLWMFAPASASETQKRQWRQADRYSLSQIASLADQDAFHARRTALRALEVRRSLRRMFRVESGFSAAELAYILANTGHPGEVAAEVLAEAQWYYDGSASEAEAFIFPRIIHTLGSAVEQLAGGDQPLLEVLAGLEQSLQPAQQAWLETLKLSQFGGRTVADWSTRAKAAAFEYMGKTIIASGVRQPTPPKNALRGDEIVWGRAPARLDLAGGWTDTPPYTLERGGCVLNAAVNINGQPPIQAYARVIDEPVIRIGSIDLGLRIEVTELDNLLDYGEASSGFALAKAALALSGLSPERAAWPARITLRGMLERFGGGIELTTLAAIPKGSGLGTSSIMGAVVLAVIQRVMGRVLTAKELFHLVLQLEQALTTGGGWQDQIGGAVDGVKLIVISPGLVPEAMITYVPPDSLDPRANGGATLLYYTGITRLAKNILQQVVGRYLYRDRSAMSTLRRLHALAPHVAEVMARKNLQQFGRLIDVAWGLNKELDPDSSNDQIEELLGRVKPHLLGAKLLGAGGGGFLLMICKSPADAQAIRDSLNAQPPNDRARFFDFDVSKEGLVVTVC